MRRTTVRLDDKLLADAKQHAARTGRTLTALIEDALRQLLARRPGPRARRAFKLETFKGTGVFPGIDLDSNAGLLDRMDGFDDAPGR